MQAEHAPLPRVYVLCAAEPPPPPPAPRRSNPRLPDVPVAASEVRACPICLRELVAGNRALLETACGHAFHESCMVRWCRKAHPQPTCPTCRCAVVAPAAACDEVARRRMLKATRGFEARLKERMEMRAMLLWSGFRDYMWMVHRTVVTSDSLCPTHGR